MLIVEVELISNFWSRERWWLKQEYSWGDHILDCSVRLPQVLIEYSTLKEFYMVLKSWYDLPMKEWLSRPLASLGSFSLADGYKYDLTIGFAYPDAMGTSPDHALCGVRYQMNDFSGHTRLHTDQSCIGEMLEEMKVFFDFYEGNRLD